MKRLGEQVVMCLTTHNRVDCARINQEIIKYNYAIPLRIVHACSSSGYVPYLEDIMVECRPLPLKDGALNLIQRSIEAAVDKFDPDYIVHLEADTWLLDEGVIHGFIEKMNANQNYLLCTSAWNEEGPRKGTRSLQDLFARVVGRLGYDKEELQSLSTQFFIIKNRKDVIQLIMSLKSSKQHSLEETFYQNFSQAFSPRNLLRMREREPVHPHKRYLCEELSLFCQHWPARGTANDPRPKTHPLYVNETLIGKREALEHHENIRHGQCIQKLLESQSFDYYNPGAKRY